MPGGMPNGKYYYICILPNHITDMRKYFTLTILFALTSSLVFGQKKTTVGVKAGVNFSNFRTPVDYDTYEVDGKGGVAFGVFVERNIGKKFAIGADFLYSQMGGKVNDLDFGRENFRYNYFSVPLVLKYNILPDFRIYAGPQCDFLIRATNRNKQAPDYDVTTRTKDIDLGWTAGVETWAAKKVGIGARYMSGTKDVSTRPETYTCMNQAIQVYAALKLFDKKK